MTKPTQKQPAHVGGEDRRVAAPESMVKTKKVYCKPELTRYEQLHGIGLGY